MWSGSYWLGLNDNDTPDTFVYTNGDANVYQNWGKNQPLSFDPYNCVMVGNNGKWSTGRCDKHESNFFCQVKSKLKKIIIFIFYNYFKEAPTECVEDTPCQASLTECVDFGNCVNPNGVLDVLDESGTPGTNGHSLQVECAASNPGAYPANNGNKFGDISCVCDGKNECKWMASEVFSGTPFQVTDVTEDNLCVTDHTCPVT